MSLLARGCWVPGACLLPWVPPGCLLAAKVLRPHPLFRQQVGPMKRALALAAAVLVKCVGLATGHATLTPGRFFAKPELHERVAARNASSCATKFGLNGTGYKFDLSALTVDIGGWVADNEVDKYHYCLNVCGVVTSDRNCICYPCGGDSYPSTQVEKDPAKGETCVAELGELAQASWTPIGQPFERKGVMLTYGGGADGKRTELSFVCDPSTTGEDVGPSFVGAKGDVFMFTWKTSYGCPL